MFGTWDTSKNLVCVDNSETSLKIFDVLEAMLLSQMRLILFTLGSKLTFHFRYFHAELHEKKNNPDNYSH